MHGCFWHLHPFCKTAHLPETRKEFWERKFQNNIKNDQKHYDELKMLGWHVIVIWECEIKKNFEITMQRVINELEDNYLKDTYHLNY